MKCVILVAGHGVQLEREIEKDVSGAYSHLIGVPKALLPASLEQQASNKPLLPGNTILDHWWSALKSRQQFTDIYLVTNADKYKYYERWASANGFPEANVINDGSTTLSNSLGAIADLELAIRTKKIADDIMVVAGDMLFDHNFDVGQVLDYFKLKKGDLAIYYQLEEGEETQTRGIVEVDNDTGRIENFLEKPKPSETASRRASPVFYCLRKESLNLVSRYTEEHQLRSQRALGLFMSWLVKETTVYGMKLPTKFQLIGHVGLMEYQRATSWFTMRRLQSLQSVSNPITFRCYARVGLIGNPSDGFHGKTIAFTISNYWAEVTIVESAKLKLTLHPLNDPTDFGSLSDLYGISRKEGYLGGLRLLQATCKKFYQYCSEHGIALARSNFTLKYDTNIPRQVGLAGSSAIITATLKCLMTFYNLTEADMPKSLQPNFVLDVEASELFIQAGLQDRVVQVYEGLVYMDFSQEIIERNKHGLYKYLDSSKLPPMWLAYLADPSDSGKIHNNVKQRWLQGDTEVIEAMKEFGQLTDLARDAIEEGDHEKLLSLMNSNFDLRRKIYGAATLGDANLKMVEIAREYGSAAKFPGSGGAVVGLCLDQKKKVELMKRLSAEGFVCCDLQPYDPRQNHEL